MINESTRAALRDAEHALAKRLRNGSITAPERALYDRVAEARDYIHDRWRRTQPKRPINGWWDLPIAETMWRVDARDNNA